MHESSLEGVNKEANPAPRPQMAPLQLGRHSWASRSTRQTNRGRFIPACRNLSPPVTPALFLVLRCPSTPTQLVLILALHLPACLPALASSTIKAVVPGLSQIT